MTFVNNINNIVRTLIPSYKKEENMTVGRVEGAVVEEIEDNHPKSAKMEIIDILCLDPDDWYVDSLADEENELGLAHGEGYLNDFMRMHDEAGITASQLDKERQLALDEELLDIYRIYVTQVYYDKVGKKLVRRQDAYLGRESQTSIRFGKQFANSIKYRKEQMDIACCIDSDLFDHIKVVDELEVKTNELLDVEEEAKEDYNKIHWNLCENFWDRMTIKVERLTSVTNPTWKHVRMLKGMYNRLWTKYRKGTVTVKDGVRKQVGGQMISSRHYAQLRYAISAYLFSVAESAEEEFFWAEKAERDAENLTKVRGQKNKSGQNIPDSYFREVSIDDLMKDEQPRMTSSFSAPKEDEILEALDYKYLGVRPIYRERSCYIAPTGAKNVEVADALFVLVRLISHQLVDARTAELTVDTKAACYKSAAEELDISMSTLRRRINLGKKLLTNSHLSTVPEVQSLISLV